MNVLELTHRSSICTLSHCWYYFYLNMILPIGNYHVMIGIKQELRFSVMKTLTLMHTSILQITFVQRYQMNNVRHGKQDASKPTRNGFVHLLRETQKPTEGTDLKSPTTLGETKWHKSHTVVSYMTPIGTKQSRLTRSI